MNTSITKDTNPQNPTFHQEKRFDWKKDFLAPFALLLISGGIGVFVTWFWEYQKFKKETLFELRTKTLQDVRGRVLELHSNVELARRSIWSVEDFHREKGTDCPATDFRVEYDNLGSYVMELELLREMATGCVQDSSSLKKNIDRFNDLNGSYLSCLKDNGDCNCSEQYAFVGEPLLDFARLLTKELNLLSTQ